jgi:hypothetical protein
VREPEPAVGLGNGAADETEPEQVRDDLQREPALLLGGLDERGQPVEIGARALGNRALVVAQQRPVRRAGLDGGQLNRPPDTCITSPVTKPASGEAR